MAREQAYRKAVTALTGSLADLGPEQEARWAEELLPRARGAGTAAAALEAAAAQLDPMTPTLLEEEGATPAEAGRDAPATPRQTRRLPAQHAPDAMDIE